MKQRVGQQCGAPMIDPGARSAFWGRSGTLARLLAAALVTLTLAAEALPGYLTLLGPGPLRFQTPSDPFAGIAALPPLLMRDPEPEVLTNTVAVETNTPAPAEPPVAATPAPVVPAKPVAAAVATNALPSPATNAVAITNAVASSPQPAAPALEFGTSQPVLTPQMLLQYFQKPGGGTNAPGTGTRVIVPLFTPPQPNAPSGSRATYSSP